jgi:hypothetical protein
MMIGIKPHEYDCMTPRELEICMEAYLERKRAAAKQSAFFAYMTAKLPLYKKFPKTFEEAFGYEEEIEEKKPQTANEMFEVVKKWNAALGGATE